MYSTIYRNTKRLFSPDEREKLRLQRKLENTQWLSRSELQAWQFAKIQQLLKYAYEHVPFYHERYQREGIHPEDIRSLEDMRALPILTREDINNHLDELVASNFVGRLHRDRTSGSTGQPMRFYYEDSWNHWDTAYRRRGRGWYGVRDGDKEAWIWGSDRDPANWSRKRRLRTQPMRRRYLNAYNMSEARMLEFAEMLVRWQPAVFRGYAQALALFAHFLQEQGITSIRPKLVETTAEKITAPQRQLLETVFGCPVANCYSSRELGTIAYPCEVGRPHVCETRYLEIVANGSPREPGHLGDVIVTSLHQYAMPLIRYKIDDMAIYDANTCTCGRGTPVLQELTGRNVDLLTTTEGRLIDPGFLEELLTEGPGVVRFQVYQPDRHHLEVRLVCKRPPSDAWFGELHSKIHAHLGAYIDITIQIVDHIKLTPAGKHRFIISDLTHNLDSV